MCLHVIVNSYRMYMYIIKWYRKVSHNICLRDITRIHSPSQIGPSSYVRIVIPSILTEAEKTSSSLILRYTISRLRVNKQARYLQNRYVNKKRFSVLCRAEEYKVLRNACWSVSAVKAEECKRSSKLEKKN